MGSDNGSDTSVQEISDTQMDVTQTSNRFKQDSSDISSTDFSPIEAEDD